MKSNRLKQIMSAAVSKGLPVPAFNIPYLPMVEPVAQVLKETDTFALMEVARLEVQKFESKSLRHIKEQYDLHADPRTCLLHLDHIPVIDEDDLPVDYLKWISEGIALGYDSVMIDGSRLPLEKNMEATARVVELARAQNVLVEAELGSVVGHAEGPMPPYDEIFEKRSGFTDPEEARTFVEQTGVDWLSVSVGSFHGAISAATKDQSKTPARLDIDLIKELRVATGIPLVLHGGSGIIKTYVEQAIANGMVKINIATDIRQPYERAIAAGLSVHDAQQAVRSAMYNIIENTYSILGSAAVLSEGAGGLS